MRPGSETPVPPPGDENDSGAAAASAAAILPSDARLRRCAFAVLRGRGIHEEADGKQVNEFFVRTFDVTLGRRSRGGGADVVISGTMTAWRGKERGRTSSGRRGKERERRKKTRAIKGRRRKTKTSKTLRLLILSSSSLTLSPSLPTTRQTTITHRRQHEHLEAARPDQVQL